MALAWEVTQEVESSKFMVRNLPVKKKNDIGHSCPLPKHKKSGGIAAFIDAEHAFDRFYASKLGVNIDDLYISQPDNGEQALEIAEQTDPFFRYRHYRNRLRCRIDS